MTRPTFSMLLPARGRPKNLRPSVESVFRLASDPERVEVICRFDECDPHLEEEREILSSVVREIGLRPLQIAVGVGARLGYSRMHEYYNQTAARARGDWLYLWNDDIEAVTPGWDTLLLEAPAFSVQFPRRDTTKTTDYTLPVVGRPVYQALGHISMNAYCDAWLSDISAYAGTSVVRDDVVFVHHRLDDETLRDQANGNAEWAKFTADEQRKMRREDMERVMAAPGWARRHEDWRCDVVHHEVDYINLAAGERRAQSVVLRGRIPAVKEGAA